MPEHEPQVGQAERSYTSTFFVAGIFIGADHDRIDQINPMVGEFGFTRFHRPTRNKHHRNIEAHRSHQHARSDFIAV